MKVISSPALMILILLSACAVSNTPIEVSFCNSSARSSSYSKSEAIEKSLREVVQHRVPGIALAVHTKEGWWQSAAGYAKIEDQTRMQTCHQHYLQSIAKTYMGVAILKLYEDQKLDLDKPIKNYLPENVSSYVPDATKISVRMLLNHTSGLPEYNSRPAYITDLLQKPDRSFTA